MGTSNLNVQGTSVFDRDIFNVSNGHDYDECKLDTNSLYYMDLGNYASNLHVDGNFNVGSMLDDPNFCDLLSGRHTNCSNSYVSSPTGNAESGHNWRNYAENGLLFQNSKQGEDSLLDFDNCESFSTRYTESSFDVDQAVSQIQSMNLKMDTLTESVLRQLETPKLAPVGDPSGDCDLSGLELVDQKLLQRLYDSGVNTNAMVFPDAANIAERSDKFQCCGREYKGNLNGKEQNVLEGFNNDYALDRPFLLRLSNNIYEGFFTDPDLTDSGRNVFDSRLRVPAPRRRGKRLGTSTQEPRMVPVSKLLPFTENMRGSSFPVAGKLTSSRIKSGVKGGFNGVNHSNSNWIKEAFINDKVIGNILSIAKDQTGCRMLQKQLENNGEKFIASVLAEVTENLVELMMDPFGNYLCQKLMSVCNESQLGEIIGAAGRRFIEIGLNMHGTRAIQKLIEVISSPAHVKEVTSVLKEGVVELVNDLNGNHVIQKCLTSLDSEDCEFIYEAMNENCVRLATHRHGCCVMQRCIDAANTRQRKTLVETITSKTLDLVEDAYGNYVIQYVLKLRNDNINRRIVAALADNVTEFAKQKFSSNVVERCLIFCPPEIRSVLINRFLDAPFHILKDLILDPYGNYVIQRVLSVSQTEELSVLLERIRPHLDELKVVSAGKRIAAKIAKRHYNSGESTLNMDDAVNSSRRLCEIVDSRYYAYLSE